MVLQPQLQPMPEPQREDDYFTPDDDLESFSDFSIDHIEPWRNKPNAKELFFDPNNIRLSHLGCNSANTTREVMDKPHGHSRYVKGCRCDTCKKGHRERIRERRKLGKMK